MKTKRPDTFGGRLRDVRHKRGMTGQQVADKTGLHFTAVSLFETGKREPNTANLAKLAKALNVTADYLLGLSRESRGLI